MDDEYYASHFAREAYSQNQDNFLEGLNDDIAYYAQDDNAYVEEVAQYVEAAKITSQLASRAPASISALAPSALLARSSSNTSGGTNAPKAAGKLGGSNAPTGITAPAPEAASAPPAPASPVNEAPVADAAPAAEAPSSPPAEAPSAPIEAAPIITAEVQTPSESGPSVPETAPTETVSTPTTTTTSTPTSSGGSTPAPVVPPDLPVLSTYSVTGAQYYDGVAVAPNIVINTGGDATFTVNPALLQG